MKDNWTGPLTKSPRIPALVDHLYAKMPEIESARARLLTESYRATQGEPVVLRHAKAFAHILEQLPIVIRPLELIVGSSTLAPRGCQTFPEYSWAWLEAEFDTVATRSADPFCIAEATKKELRAIHADWRGQTTSELATAYMAPETLRAIDHAVFTPGNYFYNGIGHVCVQYDKVLAIGYEGILADARARLDACRVSDADYAERAAFLRAVMVSCEAVIAYAGRYAVLAEREAAACSDPKRRAELDQIAKNCARVPAKGATGFYEACQSFWFVQQLLQVEGSGHSISPGRFDQYMYPYLKADLDGGRITLDFAQELLDCIWVKLNDLNKCRDAASAEGFAGYSLFQNLVVGGQTEDGEDATNDLSFMCITASRHVFLPMPSLSIRVWNGSPQELLLHAAELTRTGVGLPAYYNDEIIIPSMMNRGIPLREARNYCIIGCVEPQVPGKTDGWHDAAFFNMCRPLELVFSNGRSKGEQISIQTGAVEHMRSFEEFYDAYKAQMNYQLSLLVNADNAIDTAHAQRGPLAFLSCMVDDCMERGKTVQEGGAVYNFTGPQGFGVANMGDALYVIKKLVFEEQRFTLAELKRVLALNYGRGFDAVTVAALAKTAADELQRQVGQVGERELKQIISGLVQLELSPEDRALCERLYALIDAAPKFGNDIPEVDAMARDAAYTYTRPMEHFCNPRGGRYQAGLYPVSANVPLGAQTGATPDGRLARMPLADGVSPSAGRDKNGPTAVCNSVARLDHGIASNGTLFNQKFHPSALSGAEGLVKFVALIRSFFDQKGMHMQFNVVSRETLLDAQKNPEQYQHLVVRVAGYSALFTTLSRSLQDDIIRRTEQGV